MTIPKNERLAVMQVALAVFKYIYDDQTASYGLTAPVHLSIRGTGIGVGKFVSPDGVFTFHSLGGDIAVFDITEFAAKLKYWNGPDFIKNGKYRSMLASLFHDLIWTFADGIAAALGMTPEAVREWGTRVMYCVWMWASNGSAWGQVEAHLAFHAIQTLSPLYPAFKKVLRTVGVSCALMLACGMVGGCVPPPADFEVIEATGLEAVGEQCDDWEPARERALPAKPTMEGGAE